MKNEMLSKVFVNRVVALIFALLICGGSITAQTMNVRLNLDTLTCNKTTEMGEDEIYFLVGIEYGNGQTELVRYPCANAHQENCHWNMNDGKDPRQIGPRQFDINLERNQSAVVSLHIAEEDGGSPAGWAQKGREALKKIKNPKAQAAGEILKILGEIANIIGLYDSDDFIGSFAVRVTNDNGSLKYEWIQGERIGKADGGTMRLERISPGTVVDKSMQYWFNGDGSQYYGRFYLDVK